MSGRSLEGKVAVVTGGAAGIGGAVTRRLAADGASVVCIDVNDVPDVEGVVGVVGDVRDADVIERAVEIARSRTGFVDILVNNVGDYRPPGRFVRTTEADWDHHYGLNLRHVFAMTHAVLPAMTERGAGAIVNVATVEAYRGIPGNAVYSAFKAGVVAFTRSLAVEVGPHGVRVNAIAPDLADTPQTPAEVMLRGRDPSLVGSWVPLGRFGDPDDYAEVVAFLASDRARFVTGQCIAVDGGTLAASGWYRRTDGKGWTNLPDQP